MAFIQRELSVAFDQGEGAFGKTDAARVVSDGQLVLCYSVMVIPIGGRQILVQKV